MTLQRQGVALLVPDNTTDNDQMGVVMFMPAYNEAQNLPGVVHEAVECLESRGHPYKVIIVDDGSTDNTVAVFRDLEAVYGGTVVLIRHEQNGGYGAALRTGLRAGLETGLPWIGFCDADGQFSPHDICRMVNHAVNREVDLIVGRRTKRADNLLRRLMGRGWHVLSRLVLGYDDSQVKDIDCGFKVFHRRVVLELAPRLRCNYALISPEMMAWTTRLGYKVGQFDLQHKPREYGKQSGANLKVIIRSLRGLPELRRTLREVA